MKIRNNLSMWLCRSAIYANATRFCHIGYGKMRQEVVDKYIVNYIKRRR